MKRSKLLIPLLSGLSILPALTIASCGDGKSAADKVADAIIKPTEIKDKVKISTSFNDALKALSSDELKAELIYDLFGLFNIKGNFNLKPDDSFTSLYKNNKVAIQTNITKYSLELKESKWKCYFLGYVSFVFIEDYSDTYKANDYVMLTFDIQGQEVKLDENNCSLLYQITDTTFKDPCIGFAKIKYAKGDKEVMQYIESINTQTYNVWNSHNWTK